MSNSTQNGPETALILSQRLSVPHRIIRNALLTACVVIIPAVTQCCSSTEPDGRLLVDTDSKQISAICCKGPNSFRVISAPSTVSSCPHVLPFQRLTKLFSSPLEGLPTHCLNWSPPSLHLSRVVTIGLPHPHLYEVSHSNP